MKEMNICRIVIISNGVTNIGESDHIAYSVTTIGNSCLDIAPLNKSNFGENRQLNSMSWGLSLIATF